MSNDPKPVKVKYEGYQDGEATGSLTVEAGGASRTFELGETLTVPKAIADRCEELRDTYRFTISGQAGSGD